MTSYEETVMLPVSSYLDLCTPDDENDAAAVVSSAEASSVSPTSKIAAIDSLTASLRNDNDESRQHWSQFLTGGDANDPNSHEALVRDELLNLLLVSCEEYTRSHAAVEGDADALAFALETSMLENQLKVRTAAFRCLAAVLVIRNGVDFDQALRRGGGECSLIGSRLADLSRSILCTYSHELHGGSSSSSSRSSGSSNDEDPTNATSGISSAMEQCREAATEVMQLLLPPHCSRKECPPAQVRDVLLMPLLSSKQEGSNNADAVLTVTQLLKETFVRSANQAADTVAEDTSDATDLRALKVESAILGQMQQMRPVVSLLLEHHAESTGTNSSTVRDDIEQMFAKMYDLAPSAVESQLDDQGGAGSVLLSRFAASRNNSASADATLESSVSAATATASTSTFSDSSVATDDSDLPSFYSNLSDPPIAINTAKQLDAAIDSINDDLIQDSELWDRRHDALKRLERILAGGIIRPKNKGGSGGSGSGSGSGLCTTFLSAVRKMPIEKQILDLRSQITRAACRFITALAYELRETGEQDCFVVCATLMEIWIPAVLKLSISGVRLMATQGMNCLLHLSAMGGTYGFPRVVPTLCNGCIGKKVHQNHRRGCVLALTAALRVWGAGCLERHSDAIGKAVSESVCNRDPSVRKEGRKAFWALYARGADTGAASGAVDGVGRFKVLAEGVMAGMDTREKKRLDGAKAEADAEWEEGGRMDILVRTGVDNGSGSPKASNATAARSRVKGTKATTGRRALAKKTGSSASTTSRPSIRERMKASALAKADGSNTSPDFVVMESRAPVSARKSIVRPKATPGRKTYRSLSSSSPIASAGNPTASKGISGRTPRKPAVPKQPRRGSALPPTTPGRAAAPMSARKSQTPGFTSTPGRSTRMKTPGRSTSKLSTPSTLTPSNRRFCRSIDDFLAMTSATQWSQKEKAFVTLTTFLQNDASVKTGRNTSFDRSFDLSPFTSNAELMTHSLVTCMKEKNIRVCRNATLCCSACLRHDKMNKAMGPHLALIIPTLFNVLAKYDKGGAATEVVYNTASSCIDTISELAGATDSFKLLCVALANHNASTSTSETSLSVHHCLTDGAIQCLVDMLCNAATRIGTGASFMPPSDMACLLKELSLLVSRRSDRYAGTPQHITRAADDRIKASICSLSKLLLMDNDVSDTCSVFLMMDQTNVHPLIQCIWTFGGEWGHALREKVVSAVERGAVGTSDIDKHKDDNDDDDNNEEGDATFGAIFSAQKSQTEQAELFSDLLSPKAKERTPDHDPLKALVDVATPKTPALPCDIATRLIGVEMAPSTSNSDESSKDSDSDAASFKSPLMPKRLNVDSTKETESGDLQGLSQANAQASVKRASADRDVHVSPMATAPAITEATMAMTSVTQTPLAKNPLSTPTGARVYTPYEKALRSLGKGKTPKLETSPLRSTLMGTGLAEKYDIRPSSTSPILTYPFSVDDIEALSKILQGLKTSSEPEDQYVMLQSLLRYAKESGDDEQWEDNFSGILECLLDGFGSDASHSSIETKPLASRPINTQDSSVDSNTSSSSAPTPSDTCKGNNKATEKSSVTVTNAASRSLYLQGLRALVKYVPQYFSKQQIRFTIEKLLNCSEFTSSYEQKHIVERTLESMVEKLDPQECVAVLSKNLTVAPCIATSSSGEDSAAALLTLKSLTKAIERLSSDDVRKQLSILKPAILSSISNRQVDMRKAAVFLIVAMQAKVGDDVMDELDCMTATQKKLVSIYINKQS